MNKLPEFNIPENILFCLNRLEENGFRAYLVGGCVRDNIMGVPINDYDITTSAKPDEIERCFFDEKITESGKKHGTVMVIIDHEPVEITTFRIDGVYTDNRHPSSVEFTDDLLCDLARRDFTVNAIAYNPREGYVDEFGGIDDINRKIIRCVGVPDERFNEDALRILRALRFSSKLGFEIDDATKKAIEKNRGLLKNISAERICSELMKLLVGKNVRNVLLEYSYCIFEIIPELLPEYGFVQHGEKHKYNVWEHTCKTVENIDPDPILRLTMLLHDVGKPATHALDEYGNSAFKNHAAVGGEIASEILARLKVPNLVRTVVTTLVTNHDKKVPTTKTQTKVYLREFGEENFLRLLKIRKADRGGLSDKYSDISDLLGAAYGFFDEIKENNEPYRLSDLNIRGGDLKKIGIVGKETGKMLDRLLDEVTENPEKNTFDELIKLAEKFRREQP